MTTAGLMYPNLSTECSVTRKENCGVVSAAVQSRLERGGLSRTSPTRQHGGRQMGLNDLVEKSEDGKGKEEEKKEEVKLEEEVDRLKKRVKKLEREVFGPTGWESYMEGKREQ